MNRVDFLKTWEAYPTQPKDATICGRIQGLEEKQIRLHGNCYSHRYLQWHCLMVGDLVALVGDQLVLLAPFLTTNSTLQLSDSKIETLKKWSIYLQQTRDFFQEAQFLELQTPTLVKNPGTEPTLDVFLTQFVMGGEKREYFLPTSPELHLKKAIALGIEKIFEIRPCFRNGEITGTHQPEFYMLEWYRAYADLEMIKQDLKQLVDFLSSAKQTYRSVTMRELFQRQLGFELTPQTTAAQLLPLAQKVGFVSSPKDSFDDLFYGIFVAAIEPKLDSSSPLFVCDYPPSQAALARLTKAGWGDRFELYWKGFEICNAFHELNNPEEQRRRMQADLDEKKRLGKASIPMDEDFLQHLQMGMPPSAGIALGLERLFMAIHGIKKIQDLRLFPMSVEF